MAIIEAKNLCKTYIANKRQNNILKNVSFKVEKGEMVGIMGPSGSGKSTLLYSVSGMDKATSGEVIFDGKDITKMKENDLSQIRLNKMGFIFQQMFMMKNLTILDNILLPSIENKADTSDKKTKLAKAENLMRKLGIIDCADKDINEVSGGQLQRACIARSMINNPDILFADEPTGALNRQSSTEVMDELCKLNKNGTTIIMVTHDFKVAARCSRVLYIIDGQIAGEYVSNNSNDIKEREKDLNTWLMNMGW